MPAMQTSSPPHKVDENYSDFFRYLVKNHQILGVEYSVHCTQLAHDLLRKDKAELTQQIKTALMMADLLEQIYRDYLIVPSVVARLRREKNVYHHLLGHQNAQLYTDIKNINNPSSISKSIRELTVPINFSRQLIARIRRLLVATAPVLNAYKRYGSWVESMDNNINPILAYAACIFFIPRVVTNLYLTGKHVIPGAWMGDLERSLGWQTRLRGQMERRWFELGNDIGALVVNVLNCFILIGALSPIGIYATAALLTFDVGLACLRTYIEISRLKKLEGQYRAVLQTDGLSAEDLEQTKDYLLHLHRRITHDQERLYIQVANTSLLLVAFSLTFSLFACFPIIPLIGAMLAIITSITCYTATRWVEHQKPIDSVAAINADKLSVGSHGFFKPCPVEISAVERALPHQPSS